MNPTPAHDRPAPRWRTGIVGASLVAYSVVLCLGSRALDGDASTRGRVENWSTVASVVAGAIYLVAVLGWRSALSRRSAIGLLGASLVARLVVAAAPPMLETDFYRYFWDGAVTLHGVNPYLHAPGDVLAGAVSDGDAGVLRSLAERSGGALASINHAHLTTIYPPLAQAAFAVASWLDPFGVAGWRCVLGAFDVLTALLLVRLLRALALPVERVVWYAANPLLLRETYAALHMDVLVLPVLVGIALCGVRARWTLGALLCALGAALKVWPAVLVPLLLAPLRSRWRALVAASVGFLALGAALWSPVWLGRGDGESGFGAYGTSWQNNDGFFRAGIWLSERVLALGGIAPWHSHAVMRMISAALLLGVVVWHSRAARRDPRDFPHELLVVVGAVFLLSPTQFPWYWLWCLPLLVVRPSPPLLLYTALLPLYYVQDRLAAVHWIEHAPVWGWLVIAALRTRRTRVPGGAPRVEASNA